MNSLTPSAFTLLVSPRFQAAEPYGAERASLLSAPALAQAQTVITSWPGYAVTPLCVLPGLARKAGVASIHYKDEGSRFGLGSFKALGGAYAVARLLCRELGQRLGRPVSHTDLQSDPALRQACADITVTCATDGNHGRSVAWGAQMLGCRCVIYINASVSQGRKQAEKALSSHLPMLDEAKQGAGYEISLALPLHDRKGLRQVLVLRLV